jgi:serine/threonine-protein kinase
MSLAVGQVFAGYTILRVLGAGAMGTVYLAGHPRLPREDALKVLPAELTANPEYRARFVREAELVASLSHPNIVGIYDRGEHEGQFWISMAYVAGTDARLLCERFPGGLPVGEALPIISAVGSALDYAHHRGLLHRDVKPANILLTEPDGQPRRIFLADFGIARLVDDPTGLTATNMAVGTVAYAAPEQLKGESLDGQADQYALACTAFHLLAGVPPYDSSNPAVVITCHVSAAQPSIGACRAELAGLDPVFAVAMAKSPADRFGSCQQFTDELSRHLDTADLHTQDTQFAPSTQDTQPSLGGATPVWPPAAPPTPPPAGTRPGRRRGVIAAVVAGVLLVVAGGVFAGIRLTEQEDRPATAAPSSPVAAPNVGPFTGIYNVNFGPPMSLDGVPAGAGVPTTGSYALRSACRSTGCAATASRLSGELTFAADLVFDEVGGSWVAVVLGKGPCRDNAQAESWEVFRLQPRPDGTLTGEYTATAANACGGKYNVTFTRTGDLDANNSLPDPATLPPRVVSPAEALRGRYHEKRTFRNGSPQQESDFSVSTDCLRTGDRCMSFFHAPMGTVEALVFQAGNWILDTSLDTKCPGSDAPMRVTKTGQYPLPQPLQNPITLLTGNGHQQQTAPCAVGVDFDETFTLFSLGTG